jgi:hypothetical protein
MYSDAFGIAHKHEVTGIGVEFPLILARTIQDDSTGKSECGMILPR